MFLFDYGECFSLVGMILSCFVSGRGHRYVELGPLALGSGAEAVGGGGFPESVGRGVFAAVCSAGDVVVRAQARDEFTSIGFVVE